jgi:hypothetical protein
MKTTTHIYWRDRGGVRRAYADLREYADVGGGPSSRQVKGSPRATRQRRRCCSRAGSSS